MEGNQFFDIDIADSIAVGQHEVLVIGNIFLDFTDSRSGHSINSGIRKCNFPIRFVVVCMIRYGVNRSQFDGKIAGMGFIVEKKVFNDIGLVTKAKHKLQMSPLGIVFHYMPKNRQTVYRYHRFRNIVSNIPDSRPLSSAKNDYFHAAPLSNISLYNRLYRLTATL